MYHRGRWSESIIRYFRDLRISFFNVMCISRVGHDFDSRVSEPLDILYSFVSDELCLLELSEIYLILFKCVVFAER